MHPWFIRRILPRSEGPNYPARAAQTVDAVVAKWIPATAALLACFVTPARAKLDARYYESPNYPVRAAQSADAGVRTWEPAFASELASFVTPARPSLDVRRYDWDVSESVFIKNTLAPPVALTAPAWRDAEHGGRTPAAAPSVDVRRYDWDVAESSWIQATQTFVPTVAQTAPAWSDPAHGGRTAAAPVSNARESTPESFNLATLVDAQVRTYVPAFDDGGRTGAAGALDVRAYSWSPSDASWIQASLSAPPTVAQTAPAWTGASQSFRTASSPTRDLFRSQSIPDIFGVPDDWITWVPIQDDGGRLADRARLDVRAYEWTQPAWIGAVVAPPTPPTVAQTWPAVLEASGLSYRTLARQSLDVRGYEWAPSVGSWIAVTLPPLATVAQTWPAILESLGTHYRTAGRPGLDVRNYEWTQPAWITVNLPAVVTVAQQWPAIYETLGVNYRTGARPALDVRQYDWAPEDAWRARVVDATVAPWAPIFESEAQSFRTGDRDRLDVRRFEWAPPYTWAHVVQAKVATWLPAFDARFGYRTAARTPLDVRDMSSAPEISWLAPVVVIPVAIPIRLSAVFDVERLPACFFTMQLPARTD